MKNLIIIGAGGCGRELLQWAKDINEIDKRWNIKGFLEYDLRSLENNSDFVSLKLNWSTLHSLFIRRTSLM